MKNTSIVVASVALVALICLVFFAVRAAPQSSQSSFDDQVTTSVRAGTHTLLTHQVQQSGRHRVIMRTVVTIPPAFFESRLDRNSFGIVGETGVRFVASGRTAERNTFEERIEDIVTLSRGDLLEATVTFQGNGDAFVIVGLSVVPVLA